MNKRILSASGLLVVLALISGGGCSKSPYSTSPVKGLVTLDGQPLGEGKVMFTPVAQGDPSKTGKAGYGPLNPDGSFVVSTYGSEDGAIVGPHWVTVVQTILPNTATATPDTAEGVKFKRYKFPQQQTVAAGQENQLDIALTSAMLSD
jgi:hypothetical protein